MSGPSGRHFLQLPGPTNVPDRVLRAMDRALIDHRGPQFADLTRRILADLSWIFDASEHVFVFPSSASGCWEAALVNTLSPGDSVLAYENGFFAAGWSDVAERLGLRVERIQADWRRPAVASPIRERLASDRGIRAVLIVHNETSTGVTSPIAPVRAALDDLGHEALLMVDAVSSLGTTAYRHDGWGVDVTICGSQKGLMLPPGLGLCATSRRALDANRDAALPRAYWDWAEMRRCNRDGFFPSTPATSLLYGLAESLRMLREEGLDSVFGRHARFAAATRAALDGWGLDNHCVDPAGYSNAATTVVGPEGVDVRRFLDEVLRRFDMSLGGGLGRLRGEVFRIGHLGDLNDLTLLGTLAGVEMGMRAVGADLRSGGVEAAMSHLLATTPAGMAPAKERSTT
jgi:alanine-glyoxylate transaminase/serine-glyoxylate transaminase/serine-pyruvate transaminase